MFKTLFGKAKPKHTDIVISVDYITPIGQKKYDEFNKFSLKMGDLGFTVDTSEYDGDEGALYYRYIDNEHGIEIDVCVGVNIKHNRDYETTIDHFDYSVEAVFAEEDNFVLDGHKSSRKVLESVERLIDKAENIR